MWKKIAKLFIIPISVLFSIILYIILHFIFKEQFFSQSILILGIIIGSYELIRDIFTTLMEKKLTLDYIAILAILTSLFTREYFVCSVIVLMLSGGNTLERYASTKARESLTKLTQRIPNEVLTFESGKIGDKIHINDVKIGTHILVRRGEVIPLDGILESDLSNTDESSLTGEPFLIDKIKGDYIRSGTINMGEPIVIRVTKENHESTYTKIIEMVKKAQEEKPGIVRLAAKYNVVFTLITLLIASLTYFFTKNFDYVLGVLVIATPCPLILATPIALIGGMNSTAKRKVIIKRLSSLESLAIVDAIIFDKTGTLTLGKPELTSIKVKSKKYKLKEILSIASAIERNSLHPLAKSIVSAAQKAKAPQLSVSHIEEVIGSHIEGVVNNTKYLLSKPKKQEKTSIELYEMNNRILLAEFFFEDKLKSDTREIIEKLSNQGLILKILTGDKKEATKSLVSQLPKTIDWKAECTPEDKTLEIDNLKTQGKILAMVGDGINDAPALAKADVGLVFSNEERTAASEAADIVFLGGDLSSVSDTIDISKNTIKIAKQSILFGIGLSTIGMIFAAFGFIVPIAGAIIQEAIDISVIFNSLRASRL